MLNGMSAVCSVGGLEYRSSSVVKEIRTSYAAFYTIVYVDAYSILGMLQVSCHRTDVSVYDVRIPVYQRAEPCKSLAHVAYIVIDGTEIKR